MVKYQQLWFARILPYKYRFYRILETFFFSVAQKFQFKHSHRQLTCLIMVQIQQLEQLRVDMQRAKDSLLIESLATNGLLLRIFFR